MIEMSLLGVHMTLLIGPKVPVPAPPPLTEALQSVQVTHNDQGRSGFQLTFHVGRTGPADVLDYALLNNPLLRVFNRVIIVVTFNVIPRVLIDGVITNQQLSPSNDPGASTLTLTGEDVSVMMDMEEKSTEFPAHNSTMIVTRLLLNYFEYGLIPALVPPPVDPPPLPTERTPVQQGTDFAYIQELARRHGYVFYIEPGPAPFVNRAYWGPPNRLALPQKALSVNMGPATNVESINFQYDALAPTMVMGEVQDRRTNFPLPLVTLFSTRVPPLALMPALPFNLPNVKKVRPADTAGVAYEEAYARAQAVTDQSMDRVVTASGRLDALRYGDMLQPRGLVGLRGAGFTYDGHYYVKSVTHSIQKGEYKQSFTLTREGTGATLPVVRP